MNIIKRQQGIIDPMTLGFILSITGVSLAFSTMAESPKDKAINQMTQFESSQPVISQTKVE